MTYIIYIGRHFLSMLVGRVMPMLGVTLMFVLLARNATFELASFAYVLASLSVVATIASMGLAAIGNLAAAASADGQDMQRLFSTGLFLAVTLAGIGTGVALLFSGWAPLLPGAQRLDPYLLGALSLTYAACIPFTIINFFFQLFFEGTGSASFCAMLRTVSTCVGIGYLMCVFFIFDGRGFAFSAMFYFFLVEGSSFFCFFVFSRRNFFCTISIPSKENSIRCLSISTPIAIGLAAQKIYFFMLNERLAQLDVSLVSQLSCFMNMAGLILVLYVAFGQTHSLYVSRVSRRHDVPYWPGVAGSAVISSFLFLILSIFGDGLFDLMCGEVLPYGRPIQYSLVFYLACSGFLTLAFAHLRALNDTQGPQLLVNTMMFLILLPCFYVFEPDAPDLAVYVNAQSAVLLAAALLLSIRIWKVKRADGMRLRGTS